MITFSILVIIQIYSLLIYNDSRITHKLEWIGYGRITAILLSETIIEAIQIYLSSIAKLY